VTLSEQNNCGKIGFHFGAEARQVEHDDEQEHEHESLTSGIGLKRYSHKSNVQKAALEFERAQERGATYASLVSPRREHI
jgi:hypothetical protein